MDLASSTRETEIACYAPATQAKKKADATRLHFEISASETINDHILPFSCSMIALFFAAVVLKK